jgi:hypothetical protein
MEQGDVSDETGENIVTASGALSFILLLKGRKSKAWRKILQYTINNCL